MCPVSKCAACPCSVDKSSPAQTCHYRSPCSLQNKNLLLILILVTTKCLDKSTVTIYLKTPTKLTQEPQWVQWTVTMVWAGLSGVQFPAETRDLSRLQNVQSSRRAHQASYGVNAGDCFQGAQVVWMSSWPPNSIYCWGCKSVQLHVSFPCMVWSGITWVICVWISCLSRCANH